MRQQVCQCFTHSLLILHHLGCFPCFYPPQAARLLLLLKVRQILSLDFSKPFKEALLTQSKIQWSFITHLPSHPMRHWPLLCSSNTTRTVLPPGSTFLHQKHPLSPNIHKPRFLTSCSNYHCIWVAYLACSM